MHIEMCLRNPLENVNPKDAELDGRRTLKWVFGPNVV
jgi:hypothetical protein